MTQLKLITALGNNKDLVLELIDFFNGGDHYRYNDEGAGIRGRFTGMEVSDLYLVCTREVIPLFHDDLVPQLATSYPRLQPHFIELPCGDITCDLDDERMREEVYTSIKKIAADNLIISSGGRKTMTNRLIEAGLLYGCMGYLTITAPRGRERRECSEEFHVVWTPARRFFETRQQDAVRSEVGDSFRSLYLLPLTVVERLRRERIGVDPAARAAELAWLERLPKADLHCHLGGAFGPALLKGLAATMLGELQVDRQRQERVRGDLAKRLGCPLNRLLPQELLHLAGSEAAHCLAGLEPLFAGLSEPRHILGAVLLDSLGQEQIEQLSFHLPADLDTGKRLKWYMACGDLGGSLLLQTEGTLRLALRWLMTAAWQEKVRFLEVRFSPDNYTRAGLDIPGVIAALLAEARGFMDQNQNFTVNFLVMATRHKQRAAMAAHVAAAITFGRPGEGEGPRITGFDLAGEEEDNDPVRFREVFMPLHQHFMNITIHAGEMADDDRIWQAIYQLHARRIGHGLKLINNRKMMGYVRDHGIAIEMCPSSNRETNSFRHREGPVNGEHYPLKEYLDFGLGVTVNTDNRGISRTTMTNEYYQAALMTPEGLSRWDIFRLLRNSFKAAFLPKDEKDRLLKKIDEEVFALVLDDFFPG